MRSQRMKEKKEKKIIKQYFINAKHRLKTRIRWRRTYNDLKYFRLKNKTKFFIYESFTLIFYGVIMLLFIWSVKRNPNSINNFSAIPDLVFQQIAMTLLVLSVVAILSNLDNKYILGEKAIEVLFSKKSLLSIKMSFNYLILAMILNIYLLLTGRNNILMLSLFLFSVWIIVCITFKFSNLYINPNRLFSYLKVIYLNENKKHLRNARPFETNKSMKLEKFKNITLQYIENGNPEYIENIDVYVELLKISLFENKHLIQEYYTEHIFYSDLIAHLSEFSDKLLSINRYNESIEVYKKLYRILNYYEVVLVSDDLTNNRINEYIEVLSLLRNKCEIETFFSNLFPLIRIYLRQLYIYKTVDLSYCRLEKLNMIFYFAHHSIFEDFYIAIISNKNLTDLEKEDIMIDLYDKIRMLKVNCEGDYSPTHISFMKKSKFNLKKVEYPHYLYAEPITLMLLKVIELEDWNRLRLFLNMNLDSTIMSYIKMACLSSVLEAFNRGKPVTRIDLVINDNQIKDVIQVLQLKKSR